MRHAPTTSHNYLPIVMAKMATLPADVYETEVAHDKWCDIYKQGFCNCEPSVNLRKIVRGKH